jgi:DNA invertase Pin-like site-specific DNA recombinase
LPSVAKLDRLARNTRFLLGIVEGCGEGGCVFGDLPEVPAGPVGKFFVTLLASVAELEAQQAAVAKYLAGQPGAKLVSHYIEIESGKRDDRPQLALALAECRATGSTLIASRHASWLPPRRRRSVPRSPSARGPGPTGPAFAR